MEEFTICGYCKNVFNNPIVLSCCGETICETDLDKLYSDSIKKDSIKCPFDNEVISIPQNGFPRNKRILKILETDVNSDHVKAKKNMNLLYEEINQYETLINNPENYIYDYYSDIQNKIDIRFESIKEEINKYHEELTEKISNLKDKCKIASRGHELKINDYRKEADILSQDLRIFSNENDKWIKINNKLENNLAELKTELTELREKLIDHYEIEIKDPKIKAIDLVGEVKITEKLKMHNSLEGNSNGVFCLTDHQNGDLVGGSRDKTIKTWDTVDGKLKYTLEGHSNWVSCLTVLKNGNLASGSYDNTIKIWNTVDGKLKYTLEGHSKSVVCLTVLQNGDLASGSDDKTIKIWNTVDGKLKYNIIKIWNTVDGKLKYTLEGHSKSVVCLTVLQNGDLASGSYDNTIKIWDTVDGKLKYTLEGHSNSVYWLTVLQNGDLASGSYDNTIKIWDTVDGKLKYNLEGHSKSVVCLTVLQNGDLASGSYDNTIKIWDTVDGKLKFTLEGHSNMVSCLTALQNGDLASASKDKKIKICS